jgi:hypothetical protein
MDLPLTQRNSTMRWGAAPQGVKQMVERCLFILIELVRVSNAIGREREA